MTSSRRAIRLVGTIALILGGLVAATLVGLYIYILASTPSLPPGTDEAIDQVMQSELPELVKGEAGYADSDGVDIWYESLEPPGAPKGTILLNMGIGADALAWPDYFIQPIVDAGYQVVRYDYRGTGLSDWIEDWDEEQPYTFDDMAADGIAILDELGVQEAHVVGMSMGGMIAQQMAIDYPDRVLSLTSIMSTGDAQDPNLPGLSVALVREFAKLGIRYGIPNSEKNNIKLRLASRQVLMGDTPYDLDVQGISEQVLYTLHNRRGYNPQASQQHLAAGSASGSRYSALSRLELPALIVHGESDPFIPIQHGHKCALFIPDAQTLWIEGMGHDIPEIFTDMILDKMFENFQRAQHR